MTRFVFNGTARIRIIEAESLKATDYSRRIFQSAALQLSPYVNLDIDDLPVVRTTTKHRNQNPTFNEDFELNVHSGLIMNITVFHDSALPPDEFVANCNISFHDIKPNTVNDLWLDLEPSGRLHLTISLEGTFKEGFTLFCCCCCCVLFNHFN